jgi:hypothetical protein
MPENDMNSMNDTGGVAGSALGQAGRVHRLRGLAVSGLAAALARAAGVDFEVPDGGERTGWHGADV